jgi:1-pyrroline-5-carboxylate dehydrogenase
MIKKDGGRIICGGSVLSGGIFSHGYYAEPTLVTGLTRRHPLVRQELFVPILIIDTFSTLAEALDEADASEYGLTAGIFSESDEEIAYFFDTIQSGVTYANRRGGATTGAWWGAGFLWLEASGSMGKASEDVLSLSYMRNRRRPLIKWRFPCRHFCNSRPV